MFTRGMTIACLAGVLAAGTVAQRAAAGPLADAAAKAEQMAAAGDAVGARETMRNAFGSFSAGLPFAVGKATLVAGDPTGFGMFTARPTSVFRPGEKIVAYVEPVGLTWKPLAPDRMESRFTVDFDLLDGSGAVLAGQKAFGNFTFTGYTQNQEVFATLTLDVSEAPVGAYVLRYHFNDTNSGKSANVDLPFSIAAAP